MAVNLIASDAWTKNFKTGTFLKLSDCPTNFQAFFKNARQVYLVLTEFPPAFFPILKLCITVAGHR